MNARGTVFALFVFCSALSVAQQSSFRRVTLCNGTDLCASGKPSAVYNVDVLAAATDNSSCVPPNVLCSRKCVLEPDCTSFNWKATIRTCELFSYTPTTCGFSANCVHYEVVNCLFQTVQRYALLWPVSLSLLRWTLPIPVVLPSAKNNVFACRFLFVQVNTLFTCLSSMYR